MMADKKQSNWICGRSELGEVCVDGPDGKGCCRAGYACHPVKKEDRWYCNRPEEQGGVCQDGPLESGECSVAIAPCDPKRSKHAKFSFATRAIAFVSLGLLLLVVGAKIWSKELHPGQLSSAHSGNIACGACHKTYQFGPLKSLHLLLTNNLKSKMSQACLSCHHLGDHPFTAHNQAITKIDQLQEENKKSEQSTNLIRDLSHLVLGNDLPKRKLECFVCHKEHDGNQPMLLKMNEQLCQSCHVHTFDDFENHPEFIQYPHKRRTNIIFDHVSHIKKHFVDEKYKQYAPSKCADCHQLNALGNKMMVKPYETTCASCHDKEIIGQARAGEKGILFIAVPGLDVQTLKEKNIKVGSWPSDAEGDLSPFTITLLAENPDFISVYRQIKNLDLEDLSDATEEQLHAVAKFVTIFNTFLKDLSAHGTAEIYQHINSISSAKIDLPEVMPEDNVDALLKIKNNSVEKPTSAEDWQSHGGWYRERTNIYYLPRKHADLFLTSWITIAGQLKPEVKTLQNLNLFWQLADPKSPGVCAKCHGIVRTDDGNYKMQWTMQQHQPFKQKFTKFSHKDHLSTMGKTACKSCHELNKSANYLDAFKHHDPKKFESNFKPMKKSSCAKCHTTENNTASCLTCHDYHIGKFNPKAPTTPMFSKGSS